MQDAPLSPAAYAPYSNPRDYIMGWTDEIWINLAIGRITEHYSPRVKVHTAYGETYGQGSTIGNSLMKMSAYPNCGGGLHEDVVWEQRGEGGFISSHRTIKTATHSGFWTYGPPTGRSSLSRTIAHCLVQDNVVVEEWLARDEWAVLEGFGLDPFRIAEDLARRSPVADAEVSRDASGGAFAGRITDPIARGVSGARPARHRRECEMLLEMFGKVWNERRLDLVPRYVHPTIVCNTVRMRRTQSVLPYQMGIIDFLARFPDGQIEVRDLVVNESPDFGLRVGVIWVLRGSYSGAPAYGPPTDTPVAILGATHFELREGRIIREWRLYDEVAILVQLERARMAAATGVPSREA